MHGNHIAESFIRGLLKESASTLALSLLSGAETDSLLTADAAVTDPDILPAVLSLAAPDLAASVAAAVSDTES